MKSFRRQLIVQVLVPVAVLTVALFWMVFASIQELLETRLEKEIELVARSLRGPVEGALRERDPGQLADALEAVSEIGRVYGAAVYDAEGRRIAMAGEAVPGPAEQVRAAALVALGEQGGQYEQFAGEAVYSYFVPLSPSLGRIDGLLQVVREQSEIQQRLESLRGLSLAVMLGALGLLLAVMLLAHQFALVRPIRRLLGDMQHVERGDRQWRARQAGPRELAQLGAGLNRMLDALDRAEGELAARRRTEQAMQLELEKQKAQAALGRFSAGVAHELGAPLSVIQADVRRLDDALADDDARRRLQRVRAQLGRTRELVGQLMRLVREDGGRADRLDPADAVESAVGGARPEAESRGVDLETDIERGMCVEGLGIRIEHAVLNLVRNALQAASGRVVVSLVAADGKAKLVVDDDGPGIEHGREETIFRPFASRRAANGGTGLGLTIVRTVAELHGGQVRAGRSERLGGARFEMHLPLSGAPR